MKRFTSSLMSLALTATMLLAAPITPREAQAIAQRFVSQSSGTFNKAATSSLALTHQGLSPDGLPDYYVFNQRQDAGFIIVSGDDRLEPVCGYSMSGTFNPDDMPEALTAWLADLQRQVDFLRNHPEAQPLTARQLSTSVAPLLTTRWHQCRPYNDLCPEAPSGDDPHLIYGGHACTGCAATSTAQVMNYYEWPKQGTGSFSYTTYVTFYNPNLPYADSREVTLSADFSQSVYQWDLMRDIYLYADKNSHGYLDENGHVVIHIIDDHGDTIPDPDGIYGNAVAKLMSDVGISVRMSYGAEGSASATGYIKLALEEFFGYRTEYRSRDEYAGDWDAALRADLDAGHPLIYSGYGYAGGHAFVIDGYDSQGRFHVNWGWAGKYDGYFMSSALDPSEYDFDYYQECVLVIPDKPLLLGDVDEDGEVSINDASALIDLLLRGETTGHPSADVDEDGEVTIGDVSSLIDLLLHAD
ncbi:MAG: C10 family peptidase [Muribaculaceae bacterium]|nr:C10 family peptidase [Muribaculaceae bacterium]